LELLQISQRLALDILKQDGEDVLAFHEEARILNGQRVSKIVVTNY